MPTILELFENKDFQSKGLSQVIPSTPEIEGRDSSTLKELYKNKDSYVYGTNYSEVKTKKPPKNSTFNTVSNFAEQETSGLRIRSAVELPNPLLYGNEVIRITARTTPILDDMKGDVGGGGLIGKGLSKITGGKIKSIGGIATAFNKAVGIPITYIPTRLIGPIEGELPTDPKAALEAVMNGGKLGPHSQEPITKGLVGANGTLLGKLLKQSGGGNPKTIVKNVAGEAIQEAKNKIRGALFGDNKDIGPNKVGKKSGAPYNDDNTYSKQLKDSPSYTSEGDRDDFKFAMDIKTSIGIDLSKVSPVYGVRRAGAPQLPGLLGKAAQAANINLPAEGRFGKTEYAFDLKSGQPAQLYSPIKEQNYSKVKLDEEGRSKLLTERGIFSGIDKISMGDIYDTEIKTVDFKNGDDPQRKVPDYEVDVNGDKYRDLIPLFIGRYNNYPAKGETLYPLMAFRCSINGLTENVSPSWTSNSFVGNPYKYYIYESVERSVSFNLQLYCFNPIELANNWTKITNLTKLAYPLVDKNLAHPNFLTFSLGDMYRGKIGILETLTYTFPDNGTWETDIDGLLLPKFIDAALTIKFIENIEAGSITGLYDFPKANIKLTGKDGEEKEASDTVSKHKLWDSGYDVSWKTYESGGTNEKKGSDIKKLEMNPNNKVNVTVKKTAG